MFVMTWLVIFLFFMKFTILPSDIGPRSSIIEFWKLILDSELKVESFVSFEFERIKLLRKWFSVFFRVSSIEIESCQFYQFWKV